MQRGFQAQKKRNIAIAICFFLVIELTIALALLILYVASYGSFEALPPIGLLVITAIPVCLGGALLATKKLYDAFSWKL